MRTAGSFACIRCPSARGRSPTVLLLSPRFVSSASASARAPWRRSSPAAFAASACPRVTGCWQSPSPVRSRRSPRGGTRLPPSRTTAGSRTRSPQAPRPRRPARRRRRSDRARGTVRFLWQADAEGRFSGVSEGLAAVVGEAGADLIGRRWDELGDLVDDPSGLVSQAFARCETWTGRVVEWRIGDTGAVVPVDLAGMPVIGQGGQLLGFRGFGLCRTGEIRDHRASGPAAGPADIRHSELLQPAENPSETAARLSAEERNACREIARALGARFADEDPPDDARRPGIAPERPPVVAPLRRRRRATPTWPGSS